MSTTKQDPQTSIVDAVFDVGLAWLEQGLGVAKVALEGSARAMKRTADSIDTVKTTLASREERAPIAQ